MFKFVETEAIVTQLAKADPDRGWRHRHSGKVREIFESADGHYLLLVATDRISAFDVVMNERVPDKGRVLNLLSAYWFDHFSDVPNHLIGPDYLDGEFAGRASLVLHADALPVEVIFRALITGSFWADFQKVKATDGIKVVHGIKLPADMQESQFFPEPLFTPSTKAEVGHDEALTEAETRQLLVEQIGYDPFNQLRDRGSHLYGRAIEHARERGIIMADTKMEWGLNEEGKLVLIDEVFTPDSSRFCFVEDFAVGKKLVCQDKQILRNYLQELVDRGEWNKEYPPPPLPDELLEEIADTYRKIFERITGSLLPA